MGNSPSNSQYQQAAVCTISPLPIAAIVQSLNGNGNMCSTLNSIAGQYGVTASLVEDTQGNQMYLLSDPNGNSVVVALPPSTVTPVNLTCSTNINAVTPAGNVGGRRYF